MTALDYFSSTSTIRIATQRRDGGEVVTPIWGVVVDGVPYVRNGYGDSARWYRRVQRTHRAEFVDGGHRYPARIEDVADEQTKRAVDEAYAAKYAGMGSSLRMMTTGAVRDYTMRVVLEEE